MKPPTAMPPKLPTNTIYPQDSAAGISSKMARFIALSALAVLALAASAAAAPVSCTIDLWTGKGLTLSKATYTTTLAAAPGAFAVRGWAGCGIGLRCTTAAPFSKISPQPLPLRRARSVAALGPAGRDWGPHGSHRIAHHNSRLFRPPRPPHFVCAMHRASLPGCVFVCHTTAGSPAHRTPAWPTPHTTA